MIEPSPAISRMPTTSRAMPPRSRAVPWVAVEMAPEIDWRSMSPRFGIARPRRSSSSFRRWSLMPAWTVTWPLTASVFEDALVVVQLDQAAVGQRDRSEGVAAPTTLTRSPGRRRLADDLGELFFAGGRVDAGRRALLVAGPVLPGEARPARVCCWAMTRGNATAHAGGKPATSRRTWQSEHVGRQVRPYVSCVRLTSFALS